MPIMHHVLHTKLLPVTGIVLEPRVHEHAHLCDALELRNAVVILEGYVSFEQHVAFAGAKGVTEVVVGIRKHSNSDLQRDSMTISQSGWTTTVVLLLRQSGLPPVRAALSAQVGYELVKRSMLSSFRGKRATGVAEVMAMAAAILMVRRRDEIRR